MPSMKIVHFNEPGDADVLKLSSAEIPSIADDEVLIKVAAAGINRPDIMQRKGHYPPPPGASPVLGLEVAGIITAVGNQVTEFKVDDAVCALVNGGGYAEYVSAPAGQCLTVPSGWSMLEAASLPETFFTVWANVFDLGQLKEGETLLVHGGTSGIGVAAIQMAIASGARVITTAGSDEKCAACSELGATLAINYKTEDFEDAIKEKFPDSGVDVILDMVAGDYIKKNMSVASRDARIVMIAFMGGHKTELSFLPMLMKRLTLTASTLRPQSAAEKARIATALKQHIWPHLESGKIKPVIAANYNFNQASNAHALMESSAHIGKIVLTI